MEDKKIRKYNSIFRRKLANKISKLKNKKEYVHIYNLVNIELDNKFSINRNGIFFNINFLSDICIDEIIYYLDGLSNITETEGKIKYKSYYNEDICDNVPRLSNQEKSILKKIK